MQGFFPELCKRPDAPAPQTFRGDANPCTVAGCASALKKAAALENSQALMPIYQIPHDPKLKSNARLFLPVSTRPFARTYDLAKGHHVRLT